jgi:tRNA G18 (ribose-2'-O)-methylase SpoU
MELLYGRHAVLESLRAGRRKVHRVYLAAEAKQTGSAAEILATAQGRGCPVAEAPRQTFERAGPVNHQGVLAETGPYPYVDLDRALSAPQNADLLYLVLDHLQDVQNVGTLLRTAEAMAVTAVLLPDRRAAEITPAVVNASAGAVEWGWTSTLRPSPWGAPISLARWRWWSAPKGSGWLAWSGSTVTGCWPSQCTGGWRHSTPRWPGRSRW